MSGRALTPRPLRALHAVRNRTSRPPERLAETYQELAERTSTWIAHAREGHAE